MQSLGPLAVKASGRNEYSQRVGTVPANYLLPNPNASDVCIRGLYHQTNTNQNHNLDSVTIFQKKTADFSRLSKLPKSYSINVFRRTLGSVEL